MRAYAWVLAIAAVFLSCSADRQYGAPKPLPIVTHLIYAKVDPEKHFLECEDIVSVAIGRQEAGRFFFFLNDGFEVQNVATGGGDLDFSVTRGFSLESFLPGAGEEERDFYSNAEAVVVEIPAGDGNVPEDGPRSVVVTYAGVVYDSLEVPGYSRGAMAEETRGIIGPEGVFLSPSTHWYPQVEDRPAVFNVTAVVPKGYEAVTQGTLASKKVLEGAVETAWKGEHPSDEAYLVAGPYEVKVREHGGVQLCTYFYESEQDLSEQYLDACARYIDMYNELLGPYPYKKFAVVENFFPTGYGMPSYTLLGKRVIRLPFIVYTSLGHEIAHNWWGNGVLVDMENGNWCEGLTTYCADYRYKLLKSEEDARNYRRDINRDYTVYVHPENDIPLTEFTGRTTRATRAIGYGKCAMVFHMLERMVGEDAFVSTLRSIVSKHMFRKIGWDTFQAEFSDAAGEDLTWFFDQWVRGKGAPLLRVTKAVARDAWPGYALSLRLEQEGEPFRITVPVRVRTETTTYERTVEMDSPAKEVTLKFRSVPVSVSLDPDHHVMRRMSPREIAPTLAAVLGDDSALVVTPGAASARAREAYAALARQLARTGEAAVVADTALTKEMVASHSLFVLGGRGENAAHEIVGGKWDGRVFPKRGTFVVKGEKYSGPDYFVLYVGRNPGNERKAIAVLAGNSGEAISECSRKIVHYGKYGYVLFAGGRAVDKGTWSVRDYPWRKVKFQAAG